MWILLHNIDLCGFVEKEYLLQIINLLVKVCNNLKYAFITKLQTDYFSGTQKGFLLGRRLGHIRGNSMLLWLVQADF